jgi:uncharacterized protein YyaL (SSP411 family)
VTKAWRDERGELERAAGGLTEIVRRKLENSAPRRTLALSSAQAAAGRAALAEQFDPEFGGFGYSTQNARRPKFPEPANLVFLLDQERRDRLKKGNPRDTSGAPEAPETIDRKPSRGNPLYMVLFTLDRMARGGIRDQLGGGYHRYATSRYWIVPHFEKMLYDNAQLASVHLAAYELTGDPRWRNEAEATFAFLSRSLADPAGGFYSSLDAETASGEGAYYVWSRSEIKDVLGATAESDAFSQVYGLKREPNFEGGRFVLLQPRTLPEQADKLGTTPERLEPLLAPQRQRLLAAREHRPAPLCDDKVITAWNGLAIAAYADGFRILKNVDYRRTAEKCAEFLLANLRDQNGRLKRTYRAEKANLSAYLEDYAFLAHGLLRLHAATGKPRWLEQARQLSDRMIADFEDTRNGGFFFTSAGHENLLARPKDPYDGALPGANSVAVLNLLALFRATGERGYLERARKTLDSLGAALVQNPAGMPLLLVGLEEYLELCRDPGLDRQPLEAELGNASKRLVSASARIADIERPAPGKVAHVIVSLTVKPGWHIYANPTGVELLKPTTLVIEPGPAGAELHVDYPPGQRKRLGSLGTEEVALYEGNLEIPCRITIPGNAEPGRISVRLALRFQPCDEKVCLPPALLTIPLELEIGTTPVPAGKPDAAP